MVARDETLGKKSAYFKMSYRLTILQSVAGIVATTIAGTIIYLVVKRKFKREYEKVGTVSKLLFYPIKAFAAQELDTAECTRSGLKAGIIHDRMWSVIDEEGYHVDQKTVPRFVLLHAQFQEGGMLVDGPGMKTLKLKVFDKVPKDAKIVKCNVFGTFIDAVDCGDAAAAWIQKFSGRSSLRLVQYVPEFKPRPSKMRGLCKLNDEEYPILFQFGQPYLVLSEASIEELNTRIEEKVTYLNFRPNIVVSGCQAFEEDKWKYVRIGDSTTLIKTTACDRCVITTVNAETGNKTDKEPLTSLRKYRLATEPKERAVFKYSPLFGMFFGLDVGGKISVGDDVYAVY